MKIISLTAENVKRLKAVHIEPDGTLQVITGRNAQGKTSVLDAIWLALGGGAAARETARPVRDGEETASVTLDLGDLIVTRTWTGDKTALKVTSADGAKYTSPQSMLDGLVGRLSFDPLAFTRLSARDQVKALLDLVDLDVDLDAMAAERQRLYDARQEIGRQDKALGTATVDERLPKEEQSAGDLIAQIRAAQDGEQEARKVRARPIEFQREVERLESQIANLQRDLDAARNDLASAEAAVDDLPEPVDIDDLEASLANIEESNAKIRANNEARARLQQKAELTRQYNEHSAKIAALDADRSTALATAKFPIDGLGFTDEGVTYQGVPFAQASAAEQIKVSLAMAMALNPTLRVIRIMDGSLLDADSMALIGQMAADSDYQLWIERVADGSDVGIVIEDGEIA